MQLEMILKQDAELCSFEKNEMEFVLAPPCTIFGENLAFLSKNKAISRNSSGQTAEIFFDSEQALERSKEWLFSYLNLKNSLGPQEC